MDSPRRQELADRVTGETIAGAATLELVVICAWCGSVKVGSDWVGRDSLFAAAVPPEDSCTHGICPGCIGAVADPPHA